MDNKIDNSLYSILKCCNVQNLNYLYKDIKNKDNNILLVGNFYNKNIIYEIFKVIEEKKSMDKIFYFANKNKNKNDNNIDCIVNVNIFEIPKNIYPQLWVDNIIELFCTKFKLKDMEIYLFSNIVRNLYKQYNVFFSKNYQEIKQRSKKINFVKIKEYIEKSLFYYKKIKFLINSIDDYNEEIKSLEKLHSIIINNFSYALNNNEKHSIDYYIENNKLLFCENKSLNENFYTYIIACYIEALLNKKTQYENKNKKIFIVMNHLKDFPYSSTFKRAYRTENIYFLYNIQNDIPDFIIENSKILLLGKTNFYRNKTFDFLNSYKLEKNFLKNSFYSPTYIKNNIKSLLINSNNFLYCNENNEMIFVK